MVSLRGTLIGEERSRMAITPPGDATSVKGGLFPPFMTSLHSEDSKMKYDRTVNSTYITCYELNCVLQKFIC